ncbi:RIMS-binding protein 3A-like [Cygnus atratus]|uniref:RIMS-binding protein 3A-like n=1 Tax=Cygnus atratus TaxID=8868 RepID=UPI0021B8128B|nr:RIMS-binding protein 3A-like [Cygnus atratus]
MIRGGVGQGPVAYSHPSSRRGPARPPSRPVQQEEHMKELEALQAQLEAEHLRSQELHRRFADEICEMKKTAEQERQLLAEKLRSKWEQQRARELQQLWELSQKQRATEIRQLLREKEARWRQAQELLQQQRDDAIRQARELQQELAEELVKHGCSSSSEARSKLQEVHRQLQWRKDSKQTAHILNLQNELELQRKLFQQYILEQAEGRPPASHSEDRAAAWHRLQTRLGTGTTGTCSSKRPGASGAAGGGGQQTTHSSLKDAHLQGEGKSCGRAVTDVAVQVAAQQEACPPGSGESQLLEEKAHLQHALEDLQRQCSVLQEETRLLRKKRSLELREEVERLQQKTNMLGLLTKHLQEEDRQLKTNMLGLLTKHLQEEDRQLKEIALKSGKTAAKTEQVDQQQRGQLETEAGKKLRPHKNLDQERSRLQKGYEELKVRLTEMINENARRAEENSQLRGQKERIEEVRSDNTALKGELVQVTEQQSSAMREAKHLQTRLKDLAQAYAEQSHDLCNREEGPVGGNGESGAEDVSFILQSSGQESLKLRKFLARYSYDPFEGPNEHPEEELPLTVGEFIYVYGDMDEDGWFVGELMDGTRGFVPSNLVEEVSEDDVVTTVPPELRDLLQDSDDEVRFCSRRRKKKRRNK